MKSSLTILFENPFWVGLYEYIDGDKYEVCKITFGAEPKNYEAYDFLPKNWHKLKFCAPTLRIFGLSKKRQEEVVCGKCGLYRHVVKNPVFYEFLQHRPF